ncbi:MAG TPA: DNA recombination protein RmuC [Propionibacteriaceae bacterium]|nr:DNA recombination protein RmuC [Propionibacteriaceae bacterium]
MDAVTVIVTLLVGLLLGAAAAWAVMRSRASSLAGEHETSLRAEAATARAEAASARADLAHSQAETERARADVGEARADAMAFRAEMAQLEARIAGAEAERDAAVRRSEELGADRESLLAQFKALSTEVLDRQSKVADASAEQRLKATEMVMAPMKASLDRFEARLTEVEKERVAIASELREQVRAVQLTGDQVRRETTALTTALRKPQVRGQWGELQLKRVVELAGMVEHCDFVQQQTSSTDDRIIRPDMKVLLAEGKFVYVDAKVPLSAFLDAQEAADAVERQRCLGLFAKNVRGHADALSGKQYWKADAATPEFVVLFMPSESLYAEALQQMPDLTEYAAGRNVIIATPSTLIAMLRAVAYGWRQVALAQSAKDITHLGRELYDRLATMGGHFDKVGRSLGASVKAYNSAVASLEGRVLVTARRFRDLQVTQDELDGVGQLHETVRQIAAPELVDDAIRVTPILGREPRALQPVLGEEGLPATEGELLQRPEPTTEELVREATRPGAGGYATSV